MKKQILSIALVAALLASLVIFAAFINYKPDSGNKSIIDKAVGAIYRVKNKALTASNTTQTAQTSRKTGKGKTTPTPAPAPAPAPPASGTCLARAKITGIETSADENIAKLAEYQTACGSFALNKLMFFISVPASAAAGKSDAAWIALKLKEFSKYGIQPIVVVEPTNASGNISFKAVAGGSYDTALNALFDGLKSAGITDAQMGTWVPFPEPNIDEWGSANASSADFTAAFNKYAGLLKAKFSGTTVSVLLNSQTYNWQRGDYSFQDLTPYVSGLNRAYVSSFGLQGFPWMGPAGSGIAPETNAHLFLNNTMAVNAANVLQTKTIWFNTGSFSAMYASVPAEKAALTPEQRRAILNDILVEAAAAKSQVFNVSVNIFAEDKSRDGEGTNWSYWNGTSDIATNPNVPVITSFISGADNIGIGLSLYDHK